MMAALLVRSSARSGFNSGSDEGCDPGSLVGSEVGSDEGTGGGSGWVYCHWCTIVTKVLEGGLSPPARL